MGDVWVSFIEPYLRPALFLQCVLASPTIRDWIQHSCQTKSTDSYPSSGHPSPMTWNDTHTLSLSAQIGWNTKWLDAEDKSWLYNRVGLVRYGNVEQVHISTSRQWDGLGYFSSMHTLHLTNCVLQSPTPRVHTLVLENVTFSRSNIAIESLVSNVTNTLSTNHPMHLRYLDTVTHVPWVCLHYTSSVVSCDVLDVTRSRFFYSLQCVSFHTYHQRSILPLSRMVQLCLLDVSNVDTRYFPRIPSLIAVFAHTPPMDWTFAEHCEHAVQIGTMVARTWISCEPFWLNSTMPLSPQKNTSTHFQSLCAFQNRMHHLLYK